MRKPAIFFCISSVFFCCLFLTQRISNAKRNKLLYLKVLNFVFFFGVHHAFPKTRTTNKNKLIFLCGGKCIELFEMHPLKTKQRTEMCAINRFFYFYFEVILFIFLCNWNVVDTLWKFFIFKCNLFISFCNCIYMRWVVVQLCLAVSSGMGLRIIIKSLTPFFTLVLLFNFSFTSFQI